MCWSPSKVFWDIAFEQPRSVHTFQKSPQRPSVHSKTVFNNQRRSQQVPIKLNRLWEQCHCPTCLTSSLKPSSLEHASSKCSDKAANVCMYRVLLHHCTRHISGFFSCVIHRQSYTGIDLRAGAAKVVCMTYVHSVKSWLYNNQIITVVQVQASMGNVLLLGCRSYGLAWGSWGSILWQGKFNCRDRHHSGAVCDGHRWAETKGQDL